MTSVAALLVMVSIALATTAPAPVSGIDFTERDLAYEESLRALYERWCVHYSVARDAGEKARRFDVFASNARFIHEFNKGDAPYTLGLNRFGDMTDDEVSNDDDGSCYKPQDYPASSNTSLEGGGFRHGALAESELPTDVDWRMRRNGGRPGCVTDVKNQLGVTRCGSCWAFAATAAVEGLNSILTDKLVPLSTQQLIDCSTGNGGCRGGSAAVAFDYVKKVGGMVPESYYPYTAKQGACFIQSPAVGSIDGYERVPQRDELALRKAVAEQPVVAAIDSSGPAFKRYRSGVFVGPCGTNLTHQVALIGYGLDYDSGTNREFWLIKNSWGDRWGEYGYMRMWRDGSSNGLCGILMDPLYPVKNVN